MNEHDTRPTPETDALISRMSDDGLDLHDREDELKDHAFKLERERDELAKWKDEQTYVESQWNEQAVAKELGLPLGTDIRKNILPAIQQLKSERDAMLEVIREAGVLIANCSGRACNAALEMHDDNDAKSIVDDIWLWSEEALAKLNPYLP